MLKRSGKVQMAHNAMLCPDRELVMRILDSVNISPFQRQLVIDTELSRMSMKELASVHGMSYSALARHKKKAMQTIAEYIMAKTTK